MADLIQVLVDDHMQTRKLFRRFGPGLGDVAAALSLCDDLSLHDSIEHELLYPLVGAHLDRGLLEESEASHESARQLIDQIRAFADAGEGDLDTLRYKVMLLHRVLEAHIKTEERVIFPRLAPFDQALFDGGRRAFAMKQEFLAERADARRGHTLATVNSGWGHTTLGRRDLANTGW